MLPLNPRGIIPVDPIIDESIPEFRKRIRFPSSLSSSTGDQKCFAFDRLTNDDKLLLGIPMTLDTPSSLSSSTSTSSSSSYRITKGIEAGSKPVCIGLEWGHKHLRAGLYNERQHHQYTRGTAAATNEGKDAPLSLPQWIDTLCQQAPLLGSTTSSSSKRTTVDDDLKLLRQTQPTNGPTHLVFDSGVSRKKVFLHDTIDEKSGSCSNDTNDPVSGHHDLVFPFTYDIISVLCCFT
jgi:hypothetical protein